MIRAVSFDADQTLWDFRGVMVRALERTAAEATRRYPQVRLTADGLKAVRDEVVERYRGRPHSLEDVREESFRLALERCGVAPGEATTAAADLVEQYMVFRFGEIEMYDDVQPTLSGLDGRYRLGLLSNGNTEPDRCGLPGVFHAVILGPDHGIEKPNPAMFRLMAERLEVDTTELVHVGDDADDVIGANAVGAVSVLIDRGERESDPDLRATAGFVIRSLAELHAVLQSVGRADPDGGGGEVGWRP